MNRTTFLALFIGLAVLASASATADDDELARHLAIMRKKIDEKTRPIDERERLVLEIAATLDRAAHVSGTADQGRSRWNQATAELDRFNAQEPTHPAIAAFRLQAAVYRWAEGRSWARQASLSAHDEKATRAANELLDDAIARLRPLATPPSSGDSAVARQASYRLALSLSDRARLEPNSEVAKARAHEALLGLEPAAAEPSLRGDVECLRADLLRRVGRLDEAEKAIEAASNATPPAEDGARTEVRARILADRGQFEHAPALIDGSAAQLAEPHALAIAVLLQKRASKPPGPDRVAVERELFRRAAALVTEADPEARIALLALSRSITDPDPSMPYQAWDTLAEAKRASGEDAEAARLLAAGALRAATAGVPEKAASFRYRAAALLFREKRWAQIDSLLSRVMADPLAGPVRVKAGLLRALALGRARDEAPTPENGRRFREALEAQIKAFPGDPSAGEALFLLGRLLGESGNLEAASKAWERIPADHPRRLDADLATAAVLRRRIEDEAAYTSPEQLRPALEEARAQLLVRRDGGANQAPIDLARARLELIPGVGSAAEARAMLDRLQSQPLNDEQRSTAEALRIVLLLREGHSSEAERRSQTLARTGQPAERLDVLDLLDKSASHAETDLSARRHGSVMLVFLNAVTSPTPGEKLEMELHHVRALAFTGDLPAARRRMRSLSPAIDGVPARLLPLVADTWLRLEAYSEAQETYKAWSRRAPAESPAWYASRYGLALAYQRAGQSAEARRLIDGLRLLHPDLGGATLRDRFESLRRRLR